MIYIQTSFICKDLTPPEVEKLRAVVNTRFVFIFLRSRNFVLDAIFVLYEQSTHIMVKNM